MFQFLLALLAGAVTVGGPCILPLLPIILGTATVRQHKLRPFAIVAGFSLAFTIFAVLFSLFGAVLGLSPSTWRIVASVMIALFGLVMLFPKLQATIFARFEPIIAKVMPRVSTSDGVWSGFLLGASLGAVWTPCAGPILGSILTLIAAKQNLAGAGTLLLAYAIGAGIPMLLIAYSGQAAMMKVRALSKYSEIIQQVFGALIVLVAIGFLTNTDVAVQTYLLEKYPALFSFDISTSLQLPKTQTQTVSEIPKLDASGWINSAGLTPESLKGKVVLIDFWTYSCINCIRSLPVVKAWNSAYEKDGLVVIGVHTPEFAFEHDRANVEAAVKRFGVTYPVALDPDYKIWTAFSNQYWPAEYLFDREGKLVHTHFGEGEYAQSEQAIRDALAKGGTVNEPMTGVDTAPSFAPFQTPETYFGYARSEHFANGSELKKDRAAQYVLRDVNADEWSIGGQWKVDSEKAVCESETCVFKMNVAANAFHLVLGLPGEYAQGTSVKLLGEKILQEMWGEDLDPGIDADGYYGVTVHEHRLYKVMKFPKGGRHTVEITVGKGIEFYAATFGE